MPFLVGLFLLMDSLFEFRRALFVLFEKTIFGSLLTISKLGKHLLTRIQKIPIMVLRRQVL